MAEGFRRTDPARFNIPVEFIKNGYFSDKYFTRTRQILEMDKKHPEVVMQVWSKYGGMACGMDEAVGIIKLCSDKPENITVRALHDGDAVGAGESVMTIQGDYGAFAHLETLYLGVITRGSTIATAVSKVINAGAKQVLYFSARFDRHECQQADGYAAHIAGAFGLSTDAQTAWWDGEAMGTMPHGLIAAYSGDTVAASVAFDKFIPAAVNRIVLVDFDDDCIGTSLKVAKELGTKLWGVRFDTAGNIRDRSVTGRGKNSYGVCGELCFKARKALDKAGYDFVKIIVSGGFDEQKVRSFVKADVPFDAVGIGSAFLRNRMEFTADIVMVNGKPCAKVGRQFNPNPRLEKA
jgi:nicotinate phosphoribosyltransferase